MVPLAFCYDDTGKNSYSKKTDSTHNVGFCDDDDIACVGYDYVLPNKDATGKCCRLAKCGETRIGICIYGLEKFKHELENLLYGSKEFILKYR